MTYILAVTLMLVISTIFVGCIAIKDYSKYKKIKKFLGINIASFFIIMVGVAIFFLSGHNALAAAQGVAPNINSDGLGYIAAALSTGLATIGAGIAVAVSASAALGAISEEPKLLGKTLIFVGLAEGIAIYGLIVSILIIGRLG